jgi:hypothetical protein
MARREHLQPYEPKKKMVRVLVENVPVQATVNVSLELPEDVSADEIDEAIANLLSLYRFQYETTRLAVPDDVELDWDAIDSGLNEGQGFRTRVIGRP